MEKLLLTLIFVPLAAGFVLLFTPAKWKLLHKGCGLVISVFTFLAAVKLFTAGKIVFDQPILDIWQVKLNLLFETNHLNTFILLFAMGFGLLISIYSLKDASAPRQSNFFYGALLLAVGGSAGILLTGHLIFLLIFWEIVTVSLYLLVITGGTECRFAATKSFAMLGASDGALLLGIGMIWVLSSGTFQFTGLGLPTDSALSIVAFLLLMLAAVTKAGAMPLHTWLPTSGECTKASIMAILPAALDKLLGIYLLVIIVKEIFLLQSGPLSFILSVVGAATILFAVLVAMVQHNLKKLLSYQAIAQVGYMVLGIATLTPIGIAGAVFHMLNHATYKCCLFLCGGAVEHVSGTAELDQLGGLGKKMPWTFMAFLVATMSMSGIPLFGGFVSKWMVYQGLVQMESQADPAAGFWPLWLLVAMFGSALTLAASVKILHSIFLSRKPDHLRNVREVSAAMLIPMMILAFLCVFFGVFYRIPLKYFIYPALNIERETAIMGSWNSWLAVIYLLGGVLIALLIVLLSRSLLKQRSVPTWTCGEVQPNDKMIVPGTHFYKTISSLSPFKQLYHLQEKEHFDLYNHGGKIGLLFSGFLKWLHSGLLPVYLVWTAFGLIVILTVLCNIW
ncbi:MAG: proton-conducting transporter membrane subunit [Phycisphaerae bacterium]|nr:proton-conducting transporter membrane subunit [Phycisphaerae bacterium]